MMTSDKNSYKEAFVWIWLPGATVPVVAGKLSFDENKFIFNYGQSYLDRDNAISLYQEELPLKAGLQPLLKGLNMPGCIRDAAPDAWGRRVILNKKFGHKNLNSHYDLVDELTFLLESGSDRIGALDFQLSPTVYEPRISGPVQLEDLLNSVERVEAGIPLSSELDQALFHGSSIGGARPKSLIDSDHKKFIAKFSSSSDLYNVIKAEFVAMRLAAMSGLNVADVFLTQSAHKDVLLIERFDRVFTEHGWQRKIMLSALTLFGLDEMMARHTSYEDLAEIIRFKFYEPTKTLKELFGRLVFNILVGNTDDHARNHASFWDGEALVLTPAFDICPQARVGQVSSQAMMICGQNRESKISSCLNAAHTFLLSKKEAIAITESLIVNIKTHWHAVCDLAQLNPIDRNFLWGRQFLNPYIFEGLQGEEKILTEL